MGCVVNGPGEARECDIGLAGGIDEFVLFEKGEPVRKIPASAAVDEFVREVIRVGEEKRKTTWTFQCRWWQISGSFRPYGSQGRYLQG